MFKNLFKKRATSIAFQFSDAENTACLTYRHVVHDKDPILYVAHDEDDGTWQFLCGKDHDVSDAMLVSLIEVVKIDPSVNALYEMPLGFCASRTTVGGEWTPSRI